MKKRAEAVWCQFSLFGGDGQVTGGTIKEVIQPERILLKFARISSVLTGMAIETFYPN